MQSLTHCYWIIGRTQGSRTFFILLSKKLSWKVMGKSQMAKSETPWLRRNRASEPRNWPTKSRWKDRGIVCPRGHGNSLCFQRDLVGQFQGSDARFLLNQGVSDFAIWGFPITFQDNFFGNKMKKSRHPCIRPMHTAWAEVLKCKMKINSRLKI